MDSKEALNAVANAITAELSHVCEVARAKGLKPMIRRLAIDFNYLVVVGPDTAIDLMDLTKAFAQICSNGVLTQDVQIKQATQSAINMTAQNLNLEEMILDND